METLTRESFKQKVFDFERHHTWHFSGSRPVIVDFYADWCGPCRALSPILQRVAETYSGLIDIYKVDTQATPELASMFNVRGIPSLLFIPVQGNPTMSSGLMPEEAFDDAIEQVFQIQRPAILNKSR